MKKSMFMVIDNSKYVTTEMKKSFDNKMVHYARFLDLDIRTKTVVYRYLNWNGTEYETVCRTALESQMFLDGKTEFTRDALSCMCCVNNKGDLVIYSPDAYKQNLERKKIESTKSSVSLKKTGSVAKKPTSTVKKKPSVKVKATSSPKKKGTMKRG